MARMETDCDMDFKKASECQFFKGSSLARKSLKSLKCCCSVDFPQEISFDHLVRAHQFLLHKFRDYFVNLLHF